MFCVTDPTGRLVCKIIGLSHKVCTFPCVLDDVFVKEGHSQSFIVLTISRSLTFVDILALYNNISYSLFCYLISTVNGRPLTIVTEIV